MGKCKRKQKRLSKQRIVAHTDEKTKRSSSKSNILNCNERLTKRNNSNTSIAELGVFSLIVAVIFLVNSLEPDNKGATGVIGIIMLSIGIIGFTYTHR